MVESYGTSIIDLVGFFRSLDICIFSFLRNSCSSSMNGFSFGISPEDTFKDKICRLDSYLFERDGGLNEFKDNACTVKSGYSVATPISEITMIGLNNDNLGQGFMLTCDVLWIQNI